MHEHVLMSDTDGIHISSIRILIKEIISYQPTQKCVHLNFNFDYPTQVSMTLAAYSLKKNSIKDNDRYVTYFMGNYNVNCDFSFNFSYNVNCDFSFFLQEWAILPVYMT